MKIYLMFFTGLIFVACMPKVMILQSPVVSMKKTNSQATKSLGEGAAVEEKWCNDEPPIHPNDDGSKHYGMIDQVIWKAHQQTKAEFFTNSRFYQQGRCVYMSANVGGGSDSKSTSAQPSSSPSVKKRKAK